LELRVSAARRLPYGALLGRQFGGLRTGGLMMKRISLALAVASLLSLASFLPATAATLQERGGEPVQAEPAEASVPRPVNLTEPVQLALQRAGSSTLDLRAVPRHPPTRREQPEREEPENQAVALPGLPGMTQPQAESGQPVVPSAAAPAPQANFAGLDFTHWGAGHPPDPNGDVGPNHYIQTVNTSIGIFNKADGSLATAITFDDFMSLGHFGNLCDTNNFGDPVVAYDSFEDRWVITDFAFEIDGSGNILNPPGFYQCFAVSKTGDPVSGGWNFFSLHATDGLGDYPKIGIWPDGIYLSSNIFGFPAGGSFMGTRVWAINKAQLYAAAATVQVVQFSPPQAEFTILPANARLQTGTPPPGSPNYFAVVWQFTNAVSIYKFHVDWQHISLSSFTGPFIALAPASWANPPASVAEQGGNALDTVAPRLMMQNQYTNLGGVESVWQTHTVRGTAAALAAPRYYQTVVTGGTVAATTAQAFTFAPDTTNRWMAGLALDRGGDMALSYTAASSTLTPAMRYAARLAGDPVNSLPQTETQLIAGAGAQSGNCGGSTCIRWGDYSGMELAPDGCTFWFTNELYQTSGLDWLTEIGSFSFPGCTPSASGGIQGTVTALAGGAPIVGATVSLGSRTTTTDASGDYSFPAVASGVYPGMAAAAAGFNPASAASLAVTDGNTTTQNFQLSTAATSACVTDTTQADFQTGVPNNTDLIASPGDVILLDAPRIDQQNTTLGNSGVGITTTTWGGQTFTPAVTGKMVQVDINLFCSGCTGTTPNLTLSLRATSGGLPTGADIAAATLTGFNSGAAVFYTAAFGTPPTLTAGTQYALVVRPTVNPSPGTYALTRSGTATAGSDVYAGGTRVTGATSGTVWSIPLTGGVSTDAGFKVHMDTGFATSGNFTSSPRDANPPAGDEPTWSTLSWTATVPGVTTLQFQVAASSSATGPFNFVGPDGTSATFFTASGASLSQFNGNRFLEYKAFFTTTDGTQTPTLNDVTVCFADLAPPDLSLKKSDGGATAAPGGTLSYTLSYSNSGGQDATGVVITETVPANTTFNAGASTAGWACTPNGNAGSTCTLAVGAVTAGGGAQTATFAVTVESPIPAGGISPLANTASIADDGTHGADPTPGNNTSSTSTPVGGAPDLSLTVSDGGASVAPGGTVAYTLSYANGGNRGASGVVITETVPANSTFNSGASTAGWICTPNGNAGSTCTFAVGSLAGGGAGGSAVFAVTAANPMPAGVKQIADSASIADDGTNGADSNPGNNSGSDTTPISGAAVDLSITVSDGGASVAPGGIVVYTLTYANTGSIGATGVAITETVPADATFNAGASTAGWSCLPNGNAGATCKLAVGAVTAGGGSHTAAFGVTAASPIPAGTTQISDTASIADDGANGTDPTPANNTSTDTTPITGGPDLFVTLSSAPAGAVAPGGTITYTLTYGNTGNRGASGVTLTETVPSGTAFVSAGSTAGWNCMAGGIAGATCTLVIGTIAGGTDPTATFVVRVQNPLPANVTSIVDTASIADDGTNGADPTPNNNSTSVTTTVAQQQAEVPTVSAAGLAVLALLLAASGAWLLLRRRRAAASR
jgi:uncharacterized repeat protein (TIGR01451 family)